MFAKIICHKPTRVALAASSIESDPFAILLSPFSNFRFHTVTVKSVASITTLNVFESLDTMPLSQAATPNKFQALDLSRDSV